LINLLFQVDDDDFSREISLKPYLKYVYRTAEKGLKTEEKEAFLKALNSSSSHSYNKNLLGRRGYCFFLSKKESKKAKIR
jgi:hypothetical protein